MNMLLDYIKKIVKSLRIIIRDLRRGGDVFFVDNIGPTFVISFRIPLAHLERSNYAVFTAQEVSFISSVGLLPMFCFIRLKLFKPKNIVFSRFPGGEVRYIFSKKSPESRTINHLDDYLIEVPVNLGSEITNRINDIEIIENRKFLIENVDLNYISTSFLEEKLKQQFSEKKFYSGIYASMIDLGGWKERDPLVFKLGYMASKGHARDLQEIVPAIQALMRRFENVTFEVFGTIKAPLELIDEFQSRVRYYPAIKNYPKFLEFLYLQRWNLAIVPLIDDEWNRSKAPTKFIECTMANIPVIASDICVYNTVIEDGVSGYLVKEGEWESALMDAYNNREKLHGLQERALEYCKREFSIEMLSAQVEMVLENDV